VDQLSETQCALHCVLQVALDLDPLLADTVLPQIERLRAQMGDADTSKTDAALLALSSS
jgi:hypothetical protein